MKTFIIQLFSTPLAIEILLLIAEELAKRTDNKLDDEIVNLIRESVGE